MTQGNRQGGMMEQARNSQLLRIIFIAVLAVMLLIPVGMIDGVISERQTRREEAVREVTAIWGERQKIVGPMLVVPYLRTITEEDNKGVKKTRTEVDHATFLPESLRIGGRLNCETRNRGIYKVPVYTANLDKMERRGKPANRRPKGQARCQVGQARACALFGRIPALPPEEQP